MRLAVYTYLITRLGLKQHSQLVFCFLQFEKIPEIGVVTLNRALIHSQANPKASANTGGGFSVSVYQQNL